MKPPIDIVVATDEAVHRKEVADTLSVFAQSAGHPFEPEPVDLRAMHGETLLGGLAGQIIYGWLWIMLLAVAPEARGKGVGAALMARAEALARDKGAFGVNVDTFAFQAPGFYERLGYEEVSRLTGGPPEEERIYFAKRF